MDAQTGTHAAWLPPEAFRAIGSLRVLVLGTGLLAGTVYEEAARACAAYGGQAWHDHPDRDPGTGPGRGPETGAGPYDLVFALSAHTSAAQSAAPAAAAALAEIRAADGGRATGDEGYLLARRGGVTVVLADEPAGLLHGLFHVVRLGESASGGDIPAELHRPAVRTRMLDHWDNLEAHPVMGHVERGYAGGSLFWRDGGPRGDLARVRAYARLLAAGGINAVAVNNVNVHAAETRLLTDRLGDVAELAGVFRPYGIRLHLSVNFASPVALDGLATADPLDGDVRAWWAKAAARVYEAIPDFGGFVVKADSEGQPGPFTYGRSHADGANMLAAALAPFGGQVHWRAFVYNHKQDWRDRSTDRARAAYDHFAPLDGQFHANVVLQVKHGPIDFQTREPVSPVIAAMPATRLAVEFQVTQEYTGQQRHVCYLGPMWSQVLGFRPWGDGPDGQGGRTVAALAADPSAGGGLVAVSNAGDDPYWTGLPLAQANLYAFGRLAWDPQADPVAVLDEWIDLTFVPLLSCDPAPLRRTLHAMMDGSWRTYERYTAPLGVGFMVRPGHHYGPDVDGYEYTPWGTYHYADRDGVGVDRSRATGTGFTGQYPPPWSEIYESPGQCPDELLLFFHHVPYGHVLRSGSTVIQHIYDTHFAGAQEAAGLRSRWTELAGSGLVDTALYARVLECLDEQVRCAQEWRDQVNAYFLRKSGVPDAHGRRIP